MTPVAISSLAVTLLIGQGCPDRACPRPPVPPPPAQMAMVGEWNYYDVIAADGVRWRVWGRPRRELGKTGQDIEWYPTNQPVGFPKCLSDTRDTRDTRDTQSPHSDRPMQPGVDMSHAKAGVKSNLQDTALVDLLTPPGGTPSTILPPETVTAATTAASGGFGNFLRRINPFKQSNKADTEAPTAAGLLILIGVVLLVVWAIRSAGEK